MAKPRVLISTDIGGSDPDDIQSMVHALLYADEFDLVGLVSSPTKHGGRVSHINEAIDAYAKDYSKLKTWSSDYPTPDYLKSIVSQGSIPVAPSQGWSSPTAGSKAIIKAAHASSEPLWVLTWGAMTDVAQALHDDPSIQSKIKLFSIGSWNTQQDPAAKAYVYNNFKDLWWVDSNHTSRGMYLDKDGNAKNPWKMSDAQGHGALGDHYYKAMPWALKMGDTPSLLYLLDNAPDSDPTASSWGGSFVKTGHGPNYWTDKSGSADKLGNYPGAATVYQHQAAIYKDFVQRLDRAKAAKPDGSPPPSSDDGTPPSSGGTNNPVIAVDDDNWSTGVGQTMWQNARYLTWNDKGLDGGLKVTDVAGKSASGATVSFASDGTIVYRPVAGWQGKDSVQYTVADKDGSSDTGTFYVQVGKGGPTMPPVSDGGTTPPPSSGTGDNGPVTAIADDMWKTDVGQTMWQNARYLTWNDKTHDGALKVTAVDAKSAAGGTVSFASDGTITYKPVAGWQGKDCVQYTVTDADGCSDTGTFHIQVGKGGPVMTPGDGGTTPPPSSGTGTGNPVIAIDDDMWSTGAGQTMWQNARYLTWNDKGLDGGLKVTDVAAKSAAGATVSFDSDGTIVYRPVAGWQGKDNVAYTVVDKDGSSDTGTFFVQVGKGGTTLPIADGGTSTPTTPPASGNDGTNPVTAVNDHWNVKAGTAHYFNTRYVLANDKAPDGGLAIKSIAKTTAKGGTVSWDSDTGTAIYKAKAGFTGKDYVEYAAQDADGSADTALIHFDVLLA